MNTPNIQPSYLKWSVTIMSKNIVSVLSRHSCIISVSAFNLCLGELKWIGKYSSTKKAISSEFLWFINVNVRNKMSLHFSGLCHQSYWHDDGTISLFHIDLWCDRTRLEFDWINYKSTWVNSDIKKSFLDCLTQFNYWFNLISFLDRRLLFKEQQNLK